MCASPKIVRIYPALCPSSHEKQAFFPLYNSIIQSNILTKYPIKIMQIKPLRQKYIPEILSWIKTEADMVQWAGSVFSWPLTQKQFREHLKTANTQQPTLYPFTLCDEDNLLGYCEISDYIRKYDSAMLSRIIISPFKRDKGLGELMIKEVLRFSFEELGLNRIGLGVFDFNHAAIKCYSKVGFVREGTKRESARVGDSFWNCHLMSILKKEWKYLSAISQAD
jgi:RimJ/RimL family protein N-acetyltransferase